MDLAAVGAGTLGGLASWEGLTKVDLSELALEELNLLLGAAAGFVEVEQDVIE
jgi:hypothetical protein